MAAGAGDTEINSTNSITTVSINSYLIVTNYKQTFCRTADCCSLWKKFRTIWSAHTHPNCWNILIPDGSRRNKTFIVAKVCHGEQPSCANLLPGTMAMSCHRRSSLHHTTTTWAVTYYLFQYPASKWQNEDMLVKNQDVDTQRGWYWSDLLFTDPFSKYEDIENGNTSRRQSSCGL